MAAATARAPAADNRWGFAAAAAAPTKTPAVGVLGTAQKHTNLPTQRPTPPAPNAWGSSSLLSLKNDGGSGSFGNINDRPSSRGSSRTSTDGSDLLDSPLAWGRTSYNSTTAISHPQRTELRSGSWRFPHSQTSFSDVLKGPLNSIAKRRPTSHGKGFTLSADDFPVLVSKSSQSNSQLGNSFQGRPTFSSVIIAARDEQRKIPPTGGDPFSTADFSMEAQQAQLHATQTPDICMPPPCIDYWHPPPDHPPDRNGIWPGGVASYGLGKPADTHGSFPVESFTHNGQSLLNQRGETGHGPAHGGFQPENNNSCYAHEPADASVKILPHLMLGKVKGNHSDALEKQVIKKDVALLEKIKCLNIKARNLRASNISEISSCREAKVGHPKSIGVEAYHVANDAPVSAVICDITSAFDLANSVSESSNHVPIGTSNVSASANLVMIDLSEGYPTIFSEAREPGESADNYVYVVGNTSRNKHVSSATNTASDIWGPGWEEHSTVDSLPVDMINTHEDQRFAGNSSQQVDVRTVDDMLNSPDYEIQNSMRYISAPYEKQLQEDERGEIGQKAKTIVKLEDLHRHSFVQSQNSNGTPGKYHAYRGNSSRKWHVSSAEDISSSISGHGWEDHQDLSFSGNTSTWQVHIRTDDMINSSDYEIQHSRRELSAQHAKRLPEHERGEIQQKAKPIVKLEDLNRRQFLQSQKSDNSPGKSADYHVYGGGNALRNRHGSSAENVSFKISEFGWEDHPTVDSMPVAMTNTHQNQSFSGNTAERVYERTIDDMINSADYETQLSWRELSAQHAQLQKEERGKLQLKAKVNGKLEELNRSSSVQNQKSNDVPLEADKILRKQGAEGSGTSNHDTSTSDTCCTAYAGNLKPLRANGTENATVPISSTLAADTASVNRGPLTHNVMPLAKKTDTNMLEHTAQKIRAQSHDSSAPKHLQVEDREGQVHKLESISRVSTTVSGTADANKGPLIHNAFHSAKNTDINMIHIDQKGASESYDTTALMHLQTEDKRRQVHSQGRILRGPPASESAGLNKGSSILNVMPSAKNNGINMKEYITRKSALWSHENSAPKHLQMEIRRRQVRSQEGVLRERSNIAESTENITTDSGTPVDTWNTEAKPHAELSTHSKNRRPASPLVFGTKNTEASSVHKAHISGVIINSAIIPVQVSSVRGFTVGSIMLGDASLAFVNQEKTVAKEVHDDVTHSCSIPKQTEKSGTNQPGVQRVKDPHGSDRIMHTPVKEPRKREQSEAGGLNCAAIPAPIQPSGNQSIVSQNSAPEKTSEMERHAHKPAYKELDLQNPRKMLPAENHTTSSDNLSTSKSDAKTVDEEALDAPTATKPENREDEKTSKHLGRSSASSNQGSTNGSASAAPGLNEQEANSVLKIMHELSDQLEQIEKHLDSSTHVAAVNHPQPTQMVMVSMPGYTWGEHAGCSQRQYHVDGQVNMWINYAANSHMDGRVMTQGAGLQTAHLLPGPISVPVPVPENNLAGVKVGPAPGWKWDTAEHVLISDTGDAPGLSTARRGAAPTQNALRVGQMDVMLGVQATGGMAYGAATAAVNPEVLYHAGPELEQLNPAWFPHVQHDGMHHHGGSGGTSVYLLGMDGGAGAHAHGGGGGYMTGPPMVGPVHPEYQLMPAVASPVAGWSDGGSAMVPALGHPAETWGPAYGEHVYYA
ncbi:uncharacterized protein LOC101778892 isoform X4 [Setaria italica]|uniref:uncharacterized protein LOC101778892 isoform X4 n=1 Tax=Setaria italica TaxID=4555 RepID=UPI000BE559DA|nr:uncharacterized protein LOC101778892 isoform X4 [Setaria italica]